MRSRSSPGLSTTLALLVSAGCLFATPAAAPPTLRQAIDASYRQDYARAESVMARATGAGSTDVAYLFWHASLIQLLYRESAEKILSDSFYRVSDRVERLCSERISARPADTAAHFYLGMSRLNRANAKAWERNYAAAVGIMLGVKSEMETVRSLDPGMTDACFALGMAEYFLSTANRFVFGLSLFGSKDQALAWLELAEARGELCQPSARFSLAYVLGEDRRYEEAVRRCDSMLADYPGNRAVMKLKRDLLFRGGRHVDVVAVGREVEQSILGSFPGSKQGRAENWLVVARAWKAIGRADSARAAADRIISWESYGGEVPWLGRYVREAKELKQEIERRLP